MRQATTDVGAIFEYVQAITDLSTEEIIRAVNLPEIPVKNVLKHHAPEGLVPYGGVAGTLAIAAIAASAAPELETANLEPWQVGSYLRRIVDDFMAGPPIATLIDHFRGDIESLAQCQGVPETRVIEFSGAGFEDIRRDPAMLKGLVAMAARYSRSEHVLLAVWSVSPKQALMC